MPSFNNNIRFALLILLCMLANFPVFSQTAGAITKIKTVVIDPGHGGKHPGTVSKNGKYKEKDITLSIGLKLGTLLKKNYPDIKVIYTRSTDKYVDLDERAAIANKNKADLFISIHVNATKSTQVSGTETFVMGIHKSEDNFEVCKTENSVITLEDNYQAKYEGFNPNTPESYIIFSLLQNAHLEQSLAFADHVQKQFKKGPIYKNRGVKQGGLLVLWKTTMPAVLTEVGFLSNTNDYNVIVTDKGQTQFAQRLFDAFVAYKKDYESDSSSQPAKMVESIRTETEQQVENKAKQDIVQIEKPISNKPKESSGYYTVQILAVDKLLKENAEDLKGRKDFHYKKVDKYYKYYIGKYKTKQEAINAFKQIRTIFGGAFVTQIENN